MLIIIIVSLTFILWILLRSASITDQNITRIKDNKNSKTRTKKL